MLDFSNKVKRQAILRSSTAALVLAALCASPALAQKTGDNTADNADEKDLIVITAAGFKQKITDAPASISVVTAKDLQQKPYITLIDAVRDLEGVDVGETSDKTGQRTISIRGMGSDYTLILVNGKRQNNHGDIYPNSFGGNQFNHIPPLDTIQRIEVIRGPASTLYGADALGGVINIITKPVKPKWGGSFTAGRSFQENSSFGDDTTFDFAASGPLLSDKLGLAVRGSIYKRDASEPDYAPVTDPAGVVHTRSLGFGGGGRTVENTNKSAGLTLTYAPDERQTFEFDYDISKQEYDNSEIVDPVTGAISYPLGTLDSIDNIWRATRNVVQPRVGYTEKQKFDRFSWSLSHNGDFGFAQTFVSLAYVESDNKGRTMPFSVAERQDLQAMWSGTGQYAGLTTAQRKDLAAQKFLPRPTRTLESNQYTLDARANFPLEGYAGKHNIVVGGQIIDGELNDGVFGLEQTTSGVKAVQEQKQWSIFAEDNWSPIDALTITAGLRHDDHDIFGSHLSPRLYGNYKVSPTITVKGGISTGFKTPKTTDLYDGVRGFGGQGTTPLIGNPDLKPETSTNTEIALYWNPTPHNGFNITFFQNKFEDKISTTIVQPCAVTGNVRPCANLGDYWEILGLGGTTSVPINIDEAEIKGMEIAGQFRFLEKFTARANYTYTDSEQQSGADKGLPLTNTAKHMANASLEYRFSPRFNTQLTWEARSDRYRGVDTVTGKHSYYKDYSVFNLGAQYRASSKVTINARINNLLDEDFTSYVTNFANNGDGTYTATFVDDYNNKDKSRSYWVSVNVRF